MNRNHLKAAYWMGVIDRDDPTDAAYRKARDAVIARLHADLQADDETEIAADLNEEANGWTP